MKQKDDEIAHSGNPTKTRQTPDFTSQLEFAMDRYDPCAFSKPAAGTYGNLGRNTITGPGFYNFDGSLEKVFKPTERINVQARAEVFNLLDQAHFYAPSFNVFSGSAGRITQLVENPGGRLIQFGLKVLF